MSDKLILVLNCGSSSLKGAVLDNETGDVLMTCLAEKMGHADAYITFKANGNKERVELTAKPDHTGAVEALLEELKKLGLYDRTPRSERRRTVQRFRADYGRSGGGH